MLLTGSSSRPRCAWPPCFVQEPPTGFPLCLGEQEGLGLGSDPTSEVPRAGAMWARARTRGKVGLRGLGVTCRMRAEMVLAMCPTKAPLCKGEAEGEEEGRSWGGPPGGERGKGGKVRRRVRIGRGYQVQSWGEVPRRKARDRGTSEWERCPGRRMPSGAWESAREGQEGAR